jgi:membrane protein YqaA with SNARE-associated domain
MSRATPAAQEPSTAPSWRQTALRVVLLLAVIGASVLIFLLRAEARKLAVYGYPGIFLISILANATLLLPAPGVAFVFAMGSVFNPAGVAVAAGAGATIGELSGYLAGFSGQPVVERFQLYQRIHGWMQHYGAWTVLLLAAIPNPFFDLAGMAAGALKMPIWQFLLWCLIGKIIKMLFFAYTGAYSIPWLVNFVP